MTTRVKFVCDTVRNNLYGENDTNQTITLSMESDALDKTAPWGILKMGVTDPDMKDFFVPGQNYFIDISKA